jgi:hypothetical protein
MKLKSLCLVLTIMLFSCQNDNKERLIEQKREAKKKEVIFNNISNGWVFNILPVDPTTQSKINSWTEWRNFLSEINQKPKSSISAFQKKASILSKKAVDLNNNIPSEFSKPQVRSRIMVVITKIKSMDLFIHLNQIPDTKVVKLVSEINMEIQYLQLQMEEIVRRSQIPMEEGEQDIIRMKDTSRAIPTVAPIIPNSSIQRP